MIDVTTCGVASGYHDAMGGWHQVDPDILRQVVVAMGIDPDGDTVPPPPPGALVGRPDLQLPDGRLILEDGSVHGGGPVPHGYHRLETESGSRRVIISPGWCASPPGKQWGWAAQLYASRSTSSWGMGDLADLALLGRWSTGRGASLVLINPLHAASPVGHQQPSPYYASSRCFANPLYLRIEDVPGAASLPDLAALAARGRALNADRMVDRDAVWALKSAALEDIFTRFEGDDDFERYRIERGPFLQGFATWCALAEVYGEPWQQWPEEFRHPGTAAVAAFAARQGTRRVTYHAWLQWLLDRQLAAAGEAIGVVQDLAIGVDPGGADAWWSQDELALGVRVGAPPDEFNTLGQDWGLPPWNPRQLAAAGYEPFIQTMRAAFRHGAGLRVDHVMGLFRLFWIPEGRSATDGTYVYYPHRELLDITALEASRANAYVVGEDLGTVEPWVREALAGAGILSYRLWWFESDRPPTWPAAALGAVSTHDLPTIAGVWTGSDLDAQRRMDLHPNEEAAAGLRWRLGDWTGCDPSTPLEEVVVRTYGALSEAPCHLLTASFEDACRVEERPNFPGTTDQWPNWRLALPVPLDDLIEQPAAAGIAEALSRTHGADRANGAGSSPGSGF